MANLNTKSQVSKLLKDPTLNFSDKNYAIVRKWHREGRNDLIRLVASHPTLKTPRNPRLDILKILLQALTTESLATEIKKAYQDIKRREPAPKKGLVIYDEWDAFVGHWVQDQTYTYIPKKDYQDSERLYLAKNEYVAADIDGWLSNYFGFNKLNLRAHKQLCVSANLLYRNGRRFYYTKDLKIPNQKESTLTKSGAPISKLCQDLKKYNDAEIQLSALVCAQLTDGKEYSEIMNTLSKCAASGEKLCYPCTEIGQKIAKSLIKIASLRIFAEPEQSILELPVNSIDSYFPEQRVGKFGMGFFSILYWLVGHPKRTLYLYSWTESSNGRCNYVATMNDDPEKGLVLNLRIMDSEVTQTGTLIYIDAVEDKFSYNISGFDKHLDKLNYIESTNIYMSVLDRWNRCGNDSFIFLKHNTKSLDKPNVFIGAGIDKLFVEDYASGIPVEVLLGSLLVPSISTKTIHEHGILREEWKSKSRYTINKATGNIGYQYISVFHINVSNVGVYVENITLPFRDPTNEMAVIIIDMPPYTRLPVSRDDIILDDQTEPIFREQLLKVLEDGVDDKLEPKPLPDISQIQIQYQKYINYTVNERNKTVVREALDIINKRYPDKLVTTTFYDGVGITYPELGFIKSNVMFTSNVERYVIKNFKYRTDIWHGKKVIIYKKIKGEPVQTFGFSTLLFVDEEYTKTDKWVENATLAYAKLGLAPTNTTYGADKYREYTKFMPEIIKKWGVVDIYVSVVARFYGLDVYYEIYPGAEQLFVLTYNNVTSEFDRTAFIEISNAFLHKFANLKGNQTYGGAMFWLDILEDMVNVGVFGDLFKKDKLSVFRKEYYKAYIDSWPERSSYRIMVYSYTLKGIIAVLTDIKEMSVKINLLKIITKYANDYITFVFLIRSIGEALFGQLVYKTHADTILKYGIPYLSRKIQDLKLTRRDLITLISGYQYYEDKLSADFADYVRLLSKKIEKVPYQIPIITKAYTLKTSQLISYLFKHNVDKTDPFKTFQQASTHKTTTSKLQMTEIAINEGTTKDFISATLTELTQNSVDAIRESGAKNRDINIYFSIDKVKGKYYLMVEDFVGINPTAFLYIAIPFLSTKTPSELATGEMGSGFFNVYRESSKVVIDSVYNGEHRISIDTPIIGANNRVIDVQKTVSQRKTNLKNRTIIYIESRKLPFEILIEYFSKSRYMATKVLSQVNLFNNINLKVNGVTAKIVKKLMFTLGSFDVYFIQEPARYPSYIFTKGIPFAPLNNYYDEFDTTIRVALEYNILINIRHGGYTPVQTRTKIIMPRKQKNEFETALGYTIFVKSVYLFQRERKHYYWIYPNFASTAEAAQIKFNMIHYTTEYSRLFQPYTITAVDKKSNNISYYFLRAHITLYRTSQRDDIPKTISNITNLAIDKLGARKMSTEIIGRYVKNVKVYDELKLYLKKIVNTGFPEVDKLVFSVVMTWLWKKNRWEEEVPITKEKPKIKIHQKDLVFTPIITLWLETFQEIAIEQKIVGYNKNTINNIYVEKNEEESNISGWYDPNNKSITINTYNWELKDRKILVVLLKNIKNTYDFEDLKSKSTIWKRFFTIKYPSATLPHEIEHARRKTEHGGIHGSIHEILWPGDIARERTFDESANDVFIKVIASGFYDKFLTKLQISYKS